MILSGAAGPGFCRRPDPALSGALLHGPDGGLLAVCRRDLTRALTGGDDAQVTRLEPDAIRRDPAALDEALRARGFFGGRPVVVIERARDTLAEVVAQALEGLTPEDGFAVLTAEGLTPRSPLRKVFEGSGSLASIGLYPDPPDERQIAALLAGAGCRADIEPDAARLLTEIAEELDPGGLRQMLESLALYLRDARALTAADVAAVAPASLRAETDRLMEALASGDAARVGPLLARLAAGGTTPDRAVSAAGMHFQTLLGIAAGGYAPKGPRGDAMRAQARRWGRARLEDACRQIFRTQGQLRAPLPHPGHPRPAAAIAERCLLRLAMMAGERGR